MEGQGPSWRGVQFGRQPQVMSMPQLPRIRVRAEAPQVCPLSGTWNSLVNLMWQKRHRPMSWLLSSACTWDLPGVPHMG